MGRKKDSSSQKKKTKREDYRVYKTYKIFPLHHLLFYSCLSVCKRDQMTDFLIKEHIGEDINTLPKFSSKVELFEHMIESFKSKPISQLNSHQNNNRIGELISHYQAKGLIWNDVRIHFQTYGDKKIHSLILKRSKNTDTLGEVVEIAIENYIINASETHYKLIQIAFKNNLEELSSNKLNKD